MQQSLKKAFAAYRIRIFSFSKCFKFFYLESNANNKHVISIYLNCTNCHYYCLYLVYALLESPNEKPRVPDESILHILHSVDVHAGHSSFSGTLGVSAKSMVVPRRTAGPGPRVGSQVLYFFLHGGYGCGCGVARFVRYAERSKPRAGHFLTRECLVLFSRF